METQSPEIQKLIQQVRTETTRELAKALVAAWGEIGAGVERNAQNPHFGNNYADLSAVVALVKPVLAKNSLAVVQVPGGIDGEKLTLTTLLLHSSGEQLALHSQILIGAKPTAQAVGSALTYLRRYALMALCGLAPVDDDGNAASTAPPQSSTPKRVAKTESKNPSYAEAVAELVSEINACTDPAQLIGDIKARATELGDYQVNTAYVARRRQLTKGK